jgi:hypothetical protein
MDQFKGMYKAKRDEQTYSYVVTCWAIGRTALWEAMIRLGDQLVGMPSGEVTSPGGVDLTGAVRLEVESAIEHRLSVE